MTDASVFSSSMVLSNSLFSLTNVMTLDGLILRTPPSPARGKFKKDQREMHQKLNNSIQLQHCLSLLHMATSQNPLNHSKIDRYIDEFKQNYSKI